MIEKINGFVLVHKNGTRAVTSDSVIVYINVDDCVIASDMKWVPTKVIIGEENSSEDPDTFVDALKRITPENVTHIVASDGIPLCIFKDGEETSLKALRTHERFSLSFEWYEGSDPEFKFTDKLSGTEVVVGYDNDRYLFTNKIKTYDSLYDVIVDDLRDMKNKTKDKLYKLSDLIDNF